MNDYTKGPWGIMKGDHGLMIFSGECGRVVAMLARQVTTAEREANARLIAAAPELLEACETFHEWLVREEIGFANRWDRNTEEGEAKWREWYDENLRICALAQVQARAAIAKATGEQ